MTFFPLHLIVVVFIVTYPRLWLAGNLSLTSSSAPLVFVGVKRRFLWTLFRNFSFNNIPSMFCLFRCWSFVYKTLECLQRNFILSFCCVLFELELLKESSQFQFIYGILKRHTSVSIAKHGAFISLMLCRSDTIKKMSFGLTSYLSHILNSDSQIKARLYEKKNILRQETGHLMPFIDNKR